jgi:glucan phosphoethanolaminetransferase (alkaline phosphatase superfamily)
MSEGRASIVGRIAIEAAAWYTIAGIFLAAYVGLAAAPLASVAAHLHIVTDCIIALACVRIVLFATGLPRPVFRLASSILLLVPLAGLILYYALVLVGVRSWGRVVTWDMVASYLPQAPLLVDATGISVWVVAAILALVCAALFWAVWIYCGRFDWVPLLASRVSRGPLLLAAAGLILVVSLDLHEDLVLPPIAEQEPFSLTLFPAAAAIRMQSIGVDRAAAARRDVVEDAARTSYQPDPKANRRNVILIVSDALRADHMGIYGYARDTTPNLGRLEAAGSARHSAPMHSVCSESVCGLLGLASSRYVHQFSSRMILLQEALARNGYRTVMIMGGDHSHFYGLRKLYGNVDSYFDGSSAEGHYINDDRLVVERVQAMPDWDGRPVMLQLHLMSTHMLGKRHEAFMTYLPSGNYFFVGNRTLGEDGKTYEKAVNFYDNGVRQFDSVVAEITEALRKKGYLANAVVAITGDHGEALGEHGNWSHQNSVYDEELRVPFVMVSYGYRAERPFDGHPMPSQVDIAPTILAELGIPRPATWSGLPLQEAARDDFAYFEQGSLLGLLDRRDPAHKWKYWEDRSRNTAYAFDLGADPAESRNAIAEAPAELKREWWLKTVPIKAQYTDLWH